VSFIIVTSGGKLMGGLVSADDIAEQIVWVASRPEHVNVAQMRE
jgi:NADP-dependent 3-hydroxy acid dehydrogenase YdfG